MRGGQKVQQRDVDGGLAIEEAEQLTSVTPAEIATVRSEIHNAIAAKLQEIDKSRLYRDRRRPSRKLGHNLAIPFAAVLVLAFATLLVAIYCNPAWK